ncbi:MAG: TonB-dependent receptor plug domain-containing protein [Phenylobacterium sp.]|uniref:TonB-dependent receptor plug domain-containing protein n=1 Tax=Phenylobacterium sp. TaxID=1871053 RepID=UPI0025EB79B2|nr:TonB-dependent receptor [Phenylobacterium sp.]MBI1199831.1 TonB-dependent receptor plug domain-containing protein [Phenylobacterium sp.]
MIALILAQAAAVAPTGGLISYPPAFFAAQRPANAAEMLQRIPGFILDDGASVRGFEGAGGNVLIDGERPASKSDNLNAILSRIPAARVVRIDVIRGGAPGIDMQGKPVVANVVLKPERTLRGQIEAQGIALPDGRAEGFLEWQASGGDQRQSWETSGFYGRGYSGLLGQGVGLSASTSGPTTHTTIDTEDDGRLEQITGAYERSVAGGRLRINGLAYHDGLKFEEDDADVASSDVESTDQLTRDGSRELGANFTRPLLGDGKLELVGLRRSSDLDQTSSFAAPGTRQVFTIDRHTQESIARGVVKRPLTASLSAEVGVEAARNSLRSRTRFEVDGGDVPVPAANVQVRERRAEAFAKASWRLAPKLTLDGQIRYERSTIGADGDVVIGKTLAFVKPRLLVTWSPDADTQVRLRVEREVGQLDFDAFVAQSSLNTATGVTAGNPDLEPERAWVGEAAFERRFWDRGAVVITANHTEASGVVDRGPVFGNGALFDRPANIGDGTRDSLKLELTLPLDRLGVPAGQLKGYATRRWSRVDDPTTGVARRISGEKPITWEAKFSQDIPRWNLTWGAELYSGFQQAYYRFNAVDAYKLDPFLMTYAEWRPRRDVNVRIVLENLTKRGYRRTTVTYDGVRDAARDGAASLSDRNFHFGRVLYVRLRKTFGG